MNEYGGCGLETRQMYRSMKSNQATRIFGRNKRSSIYVISKENVLSSLVVKERESRPNSTLCNHKSMDLTKTNEFQEEMDSTKHVIDILHGNTEQINGSEVLSN